MLKHFLIGTFNFFNWEATADDVAPLIHAHPTLSEAMGEAHMALAGKPLHAHG